MGTGLGPELVKELSQLAPVTIASLQDLLEARSLSKHEANTLLMRMIALGVITVTHEGLTFEESSIELHPEKLEHLEVPPPVKPGRRGAERESIELVATVPIRLLSTLAERKILLTEDVFRGLITSSRHELLIVSPFIEREGIYALRSELAAACSRGVKLRLLTRDSEHPNTALALSDLFEIFGSKLLTREFHARARLYGEFYTQIESTHAKLLVRDGVEAYLGSAEIRPNALHTNFEMGIRTAIPSIVMAACQLFETFWNDSAVTKETNLDSLRERVVRLVRAS